MFDSSKHSSVLPSILHSTVSTSTKHSKPLLYSQVATSDVDHVEVSPIRSPSAIMFQQVFRLLPFPVSATALQRTSRCEYATNHMRDAPQLQQTISSRDNRRVWEKWDRDGTGIAPVGQLAVMRTASAFRSSGLWKPDAFARRAGAEGLSTQRC